jgi:uroporphyrinogen-III synthase
LFAIVPVAWAMPRGAFDGLLLTSANAVRHAGPLPDLPVHAVGEATAQAARTSGARVVSVGTGGVEALLARVDPALRLLHLAGEDRVPVPVGRSVAAVTVYRAEPLDLPPPAIVEGAVLLVHSPAAGRRVSEVDCRRERVRIAAISPAAAMACGTGWERLEAAAEPADAALLSLGAELCKEQAP